MLESNIWAVAGANTDPSKYGNMIYRKLRSKGYRVYPVNPLYDMVEGYKCYKSLSELPEISDEKVIKKVEELNLSAVQACALVATG